MKKLNKSDIVNKIYQLYDKQCSKSSINNMILDFFDYITQKICEDDRVEIRNFGSFKVTKHNRQKLYNPIDRILIDTEPYYVISFKVSSVITQKLLKKVL